jgi:hypothetical protein
MFQLHCFALLSLAPTLIQNMRAFFISLILGLMFLPTSAQDTLLLMNGKQLPGKISEESQIYILLEVPKKNGKTKLLSYERAEIYSFQKPGKDSILYQKDPLLGKELSQEEMRFFMHGQTDARFGHPMLYNQLGGFAFGLGSTLALDGGALPFLTPVVYSLSMQIPIVRVKDTAISNRNSAISPYYLEGYNATARSKKFIKGFLSTMVGVFVGSGVVLLTD